MKLLVPLTGFMLAFAAMMPLSSSAQAGKSIACKAKSMEGKATKWSCKSGVLLQPAPQSRDVRQGPVVPVSEAASD